MGALAGPPSSRVGSRCRPLTIVTPERCRYEGGVCVRSESQQLTI